MGAPERSAGTRLIVQDQLSASSARVARPPAGGNADGDGRLPTHGCLCFARIAVRPAIAIEMRKILSLNSNDDTGGCRAMAARRSFLILALVVGLAVPAAGSGAESKTSALKTQEGTATYYAERFHGQTTASGVQFDQNALMAAHHRWPFGTKVRVIHLENDRAVQVRIVDRLAKRSKAIIDLSRKAAKELRFLRTGEGRIRVRLEVLEWGE
jgi:rare lipoprotein A